MTNPHPSTLLTDVLEKWHPTEHGLYVLHVFEHKLELCQYGYAPTGTKTIARLTASQINDGLNATQWQKLEHKIRQLQKAGKL